VFSLQLRPFDVPWRCHISPVVSVYQLGTMK